ncbi:MAG: hypothetical protein J6K31_08565 [Parabacteroides sp.]|nr:hypothetical protein [Parabacteroides sp.]
MKKRVFLLFSLFLISHSFSFGQTLDKECFLHKWSVGAGYNFLNDPENPFDKRTFELSVKYRLTDKHSFYLMVPLYVENSKRIRKKYSFENVIPWLHRIWGTELGYNYTMFDWKRLCLFGGIGLSYLHACQDVKYPTDWVGEWGNKHPTDYFMIKKKYNGYGLSPQVGISYQFQHIGCELKYKYSLYRMKRDVRWIESDGSISDAYGGKRYYFESLHGLSIGLFYYF